MLRPSLSSSSSTCSSTRSLIRSLLSDFASALSGCFAASPERTASTSAFTVPGWFCGAAAPINATPASSHLVLMADV